MIAARMWKGEERFTAQEQHCHSLGAHLVSALVQLPGHQRLGSVAVAFCTNAGRRAGQGSHSL